MKRSIASFRDRCQRTQMLSYEARVRRRYDRSGQITMLCGRLSRANRVRKSQNCTTRRVEWSVPPKETALRTIDGQKYRAHSSMDAAAANRHPTFEHDPNAVG